MEENKFSMVSGGGDDEEDGKSEMVIPVLRDEEGRDIGKEEGIVNDRVLEQVLEEEGNVSLDEGDIKMLQLFMQNPKPKMKSHADYINNGVKGPFKRGGAIRVESHIP